MLVCIQLDTRQENIKLNFAHTSKTVDYSGLSWLFFTARKTAHLLRSNLDLLMFWGFPLLEIMNCTRPCHHVDVQH